jgi:serine phosphatase RsbU (regulator of sigma subunit)
MEFSVKYYLLCLFSVITYCTSVAQNHIADSLEAVVKTQQDDSNKVNTLNLLSKNQWGTGKYGPALANATSAKTLAEKLGYNTGLAGALKNGAIIYWYQGNYPLALDYDFKALDINKKLNNKKGIASCLGNIGIIYDEQGSYDKAMDYYNQSLSIYQSIGEKNGIAGVVNAIGVVYREQKNYAKAREYYEKAMTIDSELGNKDGIARILGNIGNIYSDENNEKKAVEFGLKALAIYRETGNRNGIALNLGNIGDSYYKQKSFITAKSYLDSALAISKEIGNVEVIRDVYGALSLLDSAKNDFNAALKDYKEYIIYRDSLINDANTKKTVQTEMNFEFSQKQAAEKAEQDKKDAIAEQDRNKQKVIRNSFIAGFILMIALAFFIFRGLQQKQKANLIITRQKEEVEQQKQLVEQQKTIVEEKNKDITDSIHYASRIQRALLTTDEYIGKHLNEYFILFKPRDIVSGDFYWSYTTPQGAVHIACCDCTGHGVPGAFMSLLNISMLNESVIERGITTPDMVLNGIRTNIIKALNPKGLDTESKDGMDCSYCVFDMKHSTIQVACANNPVWIVRNGTQSVEEIAPDKMPVGIQYGTEKPFTLHTVKLNKGDCIYMFTDGYADQFGGPKGKKFKYKTLQEKLIAISHKPLADQKQILENTIQNWKGDLEQVDDILVIGIRI